MLTVEQYREKVLALADELPSQLSPIISGIGCILASDLEALLPVPPFDNSAMDGFAIRSCDVSSVTASPSSNNECVSGKITANTKSATSSGDGVVLHVVTDIPAGTHSPVHIEPGECARIMTGAPLPYGSDAVVPIESTDHSSGPLPQHITVYEGVPTGKHIRYRGENCTPGEIILPRGTLWTPSAAASAASLGYSEVPLIRRPKVAILATGSELVPPGTPPGYGQIPDSNSALLAGLCAQFGAEVLVARSVSDSPSDFHHALKGLSDADLIVTSGGVSMGAYEVVRQVTEGTVTFHKVAMQPGKPQACGHVSIDEGITIPLIGLPGNPVAVFVSAWVFLRPLLRKMSGRHTEMNTREVVAETGWSCPAKRRQYIPVIVENNYIHPVHYLGSGSHIVASLALANAVAIVPEDVEEVKPGQILTIFHTDTSLFS